MEKPIRPDQSFHFIGICGIGMSALAKFLYEKGLNVTGSDQKQSAEFQSLRKKGIKIFANQGSSNIKELLNDSNPQNLKIIVSSAIPENNPELLAARKANLQILHRSDLLAELTSNQPSIVVTGTHGKTTTSASIATLLAVAKQDPSLLIGGYIPYFASNSFYGTGSYLVAEGDESDGSIKKIKSDIGLITNLELDHTDFYSNISKLIKTIQEFAKKSKCLLANYDCTNLRSNLKATKWWSIKTCKNVDFAALPISMNGNETIADIYENEKLIARVKVGIPGLHNLSNIIAAIAACRVYGLEYKEIEKSIPALEMPKRRFEFKGSWKGRQIFDDYAHHPSEILATLNMAKLTIDNGSKNFSNDVKRIFLVFQPHRYSRTKEFLQEFANVLAYTNIDYLLLAPIFAAGEKQIKGINSLLLAHKINQINPSLTISIAKDFNEVSELIQRNSLKDDLIITMGAGNITTIWDNLKTLNNDFKCLDNLAA